MALAPTSPTSPTNGISDSPTRQLAINETHIFSPGVENDFHFTWDRIFPRLVPTGYGKVGQADFGITGMPNASEKLGIPTFDIQNYSRLGSTRDTLFFELQQTFAVSNVTNLARGRHAIKFGGEIRRNFGTLSVNLAQPRKLQYSIKFIF